MKAVFNDGLILKENLGFDYKRKEFIKQPIGHKRGFPAIVTIKNKETGEVLFSGFNKTMIAGGEYMAMEMFDLPHDSFITPTYNNALNLDNTVNTSNPETTYRTRLFCIGTSGCNRESAIEYEVNNKQWIKPDELVPFQYVPFNKDLNQTQRNIYFGKKTISNLERYAYYFKKFDSDPVLTRQLQDGTPIDATIYDNDSELPAQVFVTTTLSISKDDCKDYFIDTVGLNEGLFNCISLCMAWTKVIGGYTTYQDIRPCTRINFRNFNFSNLDIGYEITYRIYFA